MQFLINSVSHTAARSALLGAILLFLVPAVFGQTNDDQQVNEPVAAAERPKEPAAPAKAAPLVSDLKGVKLGMTADEVKKVLGSSDSSDATGMYFDLKNGESLQLQLGPDKRVYMIAMMYSGKDADTPDITAVFGPDAKAEPDAGGRVYKLVKYPSAGYVLMYSHIKAGDTPMTTITMTKL
jgi:hypothetical protein